MARKTITKSKPATKQLVKKYQFAGANSSTYQQVANPYYISGTFSEQSAQEADRAYKEAISLGDFAAAEQIKVDADRKAREASEKAALDQVKAETKLANQQEVNSSLSSGLTSGLELTTSYFKQKAAQKAAEEAATKTATNALTTGATSAIASGVSSAAPTAINAATPALSTAAASGSGMASAAATQLVDDVGNVIVPGLTNTAGSTAASTGANVAGTGASIGTGLATAGIGLGLNIGGMLVEKSGDDNDPTTFTGKEGRRNTLGEAMKVAGAGVGGGAALGSIIGSAGGPIGTVGGAIIGGAVGAIGGLIKARKENKESKRIADEYAEEQRRLEAERAEAERKRKAELTKQKDILAQRYNQAFTGSRLMGMQTGFGYNTSTNMNMQPTSSFYGETGGARKVPGGQIVPIKGSDAVEFVGRKHSQGGIMIDPKTEVEGGETMDQVMMNGGKPNDYFFSSYLKLGGKSFAKRHKEILKSGGSQADIQRLAKMQEAVASKKEPDRGPEQIAAYGGIHHYKMAGPEQSAMAQSNMDAANVTLRDVNKANAMAPRDQQSAAPGKRTTNSGMVKTYQTAGFPEGTRPLAAGEYGTSTSMQGVPSGQHEGAKFYGNVTEAQYADMKAANPWFDFSNFDPSNKDQVLNFQKEYNSRVRSGEKLKEDGKFGEQTATSRLYVANLKDIPTKGGLDEPIKKAEIDLTKDTGLPKSEKTTDLQVADTRRGINGSLLAGLGQLVPVGYALFNKYKTEGNLPRMVGGGNVGAGSVRGAILPRVNMNAERAAAERNTVAIKNAIQNTNAGPGGIAAMMAANTAQNTQMLTIANQEQEANKQLAAEEAKLGQEASTTNAAMAQRANMANVENRLAVNKANLEAGIQEAKLKIDEKRYKREEILGALDKAAGRIAGIVKDERSYRAQERLADALDETGSYNRRTVYENLKRESKRKDSPYYGMSDDKLKKIASNTVNQSMFGKKEEEDKNTQKMGGARKYTSRLGQLSKGKKTFNI